MEERTVEAVLGARVDISVCRHCQAFWFDPFESRQITPESTLGLLRLIAEEAAKPGEGHFRSESYCPKCRARLRLAHDRQRNTTFTYWKCERDHGRFTRFAEFLKEKDFVRPLSAAQLVELRRNIRMINCSNCGAPIDLAKASACAHCASPVSMLDLGKMVDVANAAEVRRKMPDEKIPDGAFSPELLAILSSSRSPSSDRRMQSFGLVEWGLQAFVDWLTER